MISWKGFWSVLTTVSTGAGACLSALIPFPSWLAVTGQAVAGLVFLAAAATVIHESPTFTALSDVDRHQMVRLMWAGVGAHLGWQVAFQLRPDLWGAWLAALALIGVVQYWTARGHQYLLTQLRRTPPTAPTGPDGPVADSDTQALSAALDRAGYSWLSVLRWEHIGEPRRFGVRVWVRKPSRMAMSAAGEKGRDTRLLSQADAEPIAIGLAEVLRREILSDWVQISKEPAAGTYTIIIVTEDVMGRIYPYVDRPAWSTITAPKVIGYGMDGQPHRLLLCQHGQVSGQSRSGKSSLIHVEFAEVSLCADAIIWVGGVEKLYDLVGGWVEPYMDTDHQLPIEWVASGQTDLLHMLVAAMTIARWRQRQPMNTRQGFTRIMLYLDEASFALRNTKARAPYQGILYTAAQLVAMLTQGAGSAGVHVRFISQRGVNSHFGDSGGDTTANAGFVAGFRTKDAADLGRLTGDYKLPVPRHPGEYWLEAGDGPVRLKAPYLQEVDPSKPRLHEGPTISDIAWTRRTFVRALDAGSASVAGDAYSGRHVRMDADLLSYLTDTEPVAVEDLAEESDGYRVAMAELDRTGLGTPLADDGPAAPAGADVFTMVGRRTLAARIAAIVASSAVPLSKADIAAALAATGGGDASDQVVTNALTKLVAEGRLQRPERGLYAHA